MKYIRTKDGRILRVPFTKQEYKKSFPKTAISYEKWFDLWAKEIENQVIKQADTIEELCDDFVVIGYKMKYPFIFSKEGISIDDFWKHSPIDTIVYGAIWTEWGLKYVAKMNEKGELELL